MHKCDILLKSCSGYFCPEGTAWREPTTFCRHGEYCPPGSTEPLDCPPNHFCGTAKLAEPSGACSAGFVCEGRSTTPRPTGSTNGKVCEENMMGRPCKKGHYCPPRKPQGLIFLISNRLSLPQRTSHSCEMPFTKVRSGSNARSSVL